MKTKPKTTIPRSPKDWIEEIALAYRDAYETIPFGVFTGNEIHEKDLFHLTPQICLKFRGIERTKANVKQATEAMLFSYVATAERTESKFSDPLIVFTFGYLASHFGMDLVTESEVTEIMDYINEHYEDLKTAIAKKIKNKHG